MYVRKHNRVSVTFFWAIMNDWFAVLDLLEASVIFLVVGLFGYLALDILIGVMTEFGEE